MCFFVGVLFLFVCTLLFLSPVRVYLSIVCFWGIKLALPQFGESLMQLILSILFFFLLSFCYFIITLNNDNSARKKKRTSKSTSPIANCNFHIFFPYFATTQRNNIDCNFNINTNQLHNIDFTTLPSQLRTDVTRSYRRPSRSRTTWKETSINSKNSFRNFPKLQTPKLRNSLLTTQVSRLHNFRFGALPPPQPAPPQV